MKRLVLTVILLVIIAFSTAVYYLIIHFQRPNVANQSYPTPSLAMVKTEMCQQNQLSTDITAQAGAGNIYATLTLINTGKTTCEISLGNTIIASFDAQNIVTHYEQNAPQETVMISSGEKLYSQVHYPNGPQCQSPIKAVPITFLYKTNQTAIVFQPSQQSEKLEVQACSAQSEKTVVDIWPLSQHPITQ